MTEEERPGVVKWARSFWDRTKDAFYIGGVVAGILVGVLKWYREAYPPTEPVTSTELIEQFDAINDRFTAFGHRDSLYRDSLRIERARYDSVMRIGLVALADVQSRIGNVERKLVMTNLELAANRLTANRTSDELIRTIQQQSSQTERNKTIKEQMEREQREKDRALMEAIAKKLKINTQQF